MKKLSLSLIYAALCASLAFAGGDVTVTTAEGVCKSPKLCVKNSGDLTVEFEQNGKAQSLKASEVLELDFGGAVRKDYAEDDIHVLFTNGSILSGKPPAKAGADPMVLNLNNPVYGNPAVKLDHVQALTVPANRRFMPRRMPKADENDFVLTQTGDQSNGTFLALTSEGLAFKSNQLGERTYALKDSVGVWLIAMAKAPETPKDLYSWIHTVDGSVIQGRISSLENGTLTFIDIYGNTHSVKTDQLVRVEMKNGRVTYLSELEPVEAFQNANPARKNETTTDIQFPHQIDKSAKCTPMRMNGVDVKRGIGVRADSALTYKLDGVYKKFQATLGLDDCAGGYGSIIAQVLVDGKKVKEVALKGKDAPVAIDVDVTGAKTLKLIVTWGPNPMSDFANWAGARLIR